MGPLMALASPSSSSRVPRTSSKSRLMLSRAQAMSSKVLGRDAGRQVQDPHSDEPHGWLLASRATAMSVMEGPPIVAQASDYSGHTPAHRVRMLRAKLTYAAGYGTGPDRPGSEEHTQVGDLSTTVEDDA